MSPDEFFGAGEPPLLTEERECKCIAGEARDEAGRLRAQRGRMRIEISAVRIGDPPISTWDWVCRSCSRRSFGGRWYADE